MPPNQYRHAGSETGEPLEKLLGELELAVMEVVWEQAPVTVRDVLTQLNQGERDLAYTTVLTVMRRLAEKEGRGHAPRGVHLVCSGVGQSPGRDGSLSRLRNGNQPMAS
ncbi:MAG: BlaI/MecI/CopY family transcriptional regulator, partial [Ardenticatenaceae bacterium]